METVIEREEGRGASVPRPAGYRWQLRWRPGPSRGLLGRPRGAESRPDCAGGRGAGALGAGRGTGDREEGDTRRGRAGGPGELSRR